MIVLLSPAKRLQQLSAPVPAQVLTTPFELEKSAALAARLKRLSARKLGELMHISADLAQTNAGRYQSWSADVSAPTAVPAMGMFQGDVYIGLDAASLNKEDWLWAQDHLRILSGLYGLLRPLDRIQPYRLEMGTTIGVGRAKNLYSYWRKEIIASLNESLAKQPGEAVILNLASAEYAKAVDFVSLSARTVQVDFQDFKNGTYKPIQLFLKQARGYMARWVIKERISNPTDLTAFNKQGYRYDAKASTGDKLVFQRG